VSGLGKGTLVLLANGNVQPVEQIRVGARLMGPDGEPRTVTATKAGRERRVRVTPVNGEPWVCSDHHVLTLVCSGTNEVVDISADAWGRAHAKFKHQHKLFSAGVANFKDVSESRPIDPYFLGVWFGDGHKHICDRVSGRTLAGITVTKPDSQILAVCKDQARRWGLHVNINNSNNTRCPSYHLSADKAPPGNGRWKPNPLLRTMRALLGDKLKIPDAYLYAPRTERLQFLAGFCDTDAELDRVMFTISQKRKDWARAIWQLARSLGFYAYFRSRLARYKKFDGTYFEGTYWVVSISGDTYEIPTRIPRKKAPRRRQIKNATRTGVTLVPIGKGDCYGFTLRGNDGRFLLGDFTVTSTRTST
jgi:type IV secretion system protein VirB4